MFCLNFLFRLVEPGASLHPLEWIIHYSLPLSFFLLSGEWGDDIRWMLLCNGLSQLVNDTTYTYYSLMNQ